MNWEKHAILEKSPMLMLIGILIVVSIGGLDRDCTTVLVAIQPSRR